MFTTVFDLADADGRAGRGPPVHLPSSTPSESDSPYSTVRSLDALKQAAARALATSPAGE